MKTKIILLLLVIASLTYEAFATRIIIRGGRNQRYYQIISDKDFLSCTGKGDNPCPVKLGGDRTINGISYNDMGPIIDFVNDQVSSGQRSGSVLYDNVLPVTWKMINDTDIEINVTNNANKTPENYEDAGGN